MSPRIALIYDRVNTPYGGAEKVLLALHEAFPYAPLYTSVFDATTAEWAQRFKIRTSWLQKIPFANRLHRWLAPLMPLAFESFDLSEFDVIISITSAEAKGVLTKPHQLHLCYLLTPTRYLYSHQQEYLQSLPTVPGLKALAAELVSYLRWWDQAAAWRPDIIIPISQLVRTRTEQYYGRTTEEVLYPPIDPPVTEPTAHDEREANQLAGNRPFLLVVSRLVDYKRIDLAIQACQALGKRLIVVGEGPAEAELRLLAAEQPEQVTLAGARSNGVRTALLRKAEALLMPGLEDFGITALEAALVGTPVILHQQSGAAELLSAGENGLFLTEESVAEVKRAVRSLGTLSANQSKVRKNLAKYATTNFCERFKAVVTAHWLSHQKERNS